MLMFFYSPEFRYGNLQTQLHFHLFAGRSGVQIAVKERDFSLPQDVRKVSGAHPVSYSMAPKLFATGESVRA
jgi:hypothetical protein